LAATGRQAIPVLAPEIVLLYKAQLPREHDEADLRAALPKLALDRRRWLTHAVRVAHPHSPFLPILEAA
jgi:hypothetical protein